MAHEGLPNKIGKTGIGVGGSWGSRGWTSSDITLDFCFEGTGKVLGAIVEFSNCVQHKDIKRTDSFLWDCSGSLWKIWKFLKSACEELHILPQLQLWSKDMRHEFNFNFKMLLFNAKLYHSPACKSPRNKKRVEAVLEQLKPKYSNLGIFDPNFTNFYFCTINLQFQKFECADLKFDDSFSKMVSKTPK